MIAKIYAKGLKGQDFEMPLSRLNLLVGPNGAGKTARHDAVMLAVLGYIPGVAKQNKEILSTYGSDDKLFVAVELDDRTHLLRRFCRGSNGSVAQDLMVNRRKATKEQFAISMAGHKVFDLRAFMELSDQKKIDWIFALYPPDGDIADLDGKIQELKERQNGIQAQMRSLEGTVARLQGARANIALPSGTIADVTQQIQTMEAQLDQARKELEAERIAQAEAKARKETEEKAAQPATAPLVQQPAVVVPISHSPEQSIEAILSAMQRSGCSACAAALVAKRELKKYRPAKGML